MKVGLMRQKTELNIYGYRGKKSTRSWIKIKNLKKTYKSRFYGIFKAMLMEEEIIILPIGSSGGIFDVNVEWNILETEHFYRYPTKLREAKYIAFYTEGLGIEKMARLKLPYKKTTWGEI